MKPFEALSRIYQPLAAKADAEGVLSLSEAERSIVLAFWAKGIIDNAGLGGMYAAPVDPHSVASAFDRVGMPELAAAVSLANTRIADIALSSDPVERFSQVEEVCANDPRGDPWLAENEIFWNMQDFDARLLTFALTEATDR